MIEAPEAPAQQATSAVSEYNPVAAGLAELQHRLKDRAYDLTTVKGNDEARKDRLELVKLRTALEAKRKEIKAPVLERAALIDSEAARIKAEILALETPIDQQIRADEARREQERLARIEAKRKADAEIRARIDTMKGMVVRSVGKSSADIQTKIDLVMKMTIDDTYGDFKAEAQAAKVEVVSALQQMQAAAVQAEAEAARLAAERAELERQRREQEEARRIAEERIAEERRAQEAAAAAERQQLEEQRRRQEEEQRRLDATAEEQRRQQEEAARMAAEAAAKAAAPAPVAPVATTNAALIEQGRQIVDDIIAAETLRDALQAAPKPRADEPATLKLGDIMRQLAPLKLDVAGMAALGVPPAKTEGAAKLYRPSDYSRLLAAIVKHVQDLQFLQAVTA